MRASHFVKQTLLVGFTIAGTFQVAFAQQSLWSTYRDAGVLQYQAGNYPEAERLIRVALQAAEGFNPEGRRVAATLNDLARVYEIQGRYSEAEPLYSRALTIMQQARGPYDAETATVLNNLAAFYTWLGKGEQVIDLYKSSLAAQPSCRSTDRLIPTPRRFSITWLSSTPTF